VSARAIGQRGVVVLVEPCVQAVRDRATDWLRSARRRERSVSSSWATVAFLFPPSGARVRAAIRTALMLVNVISSLYTLATRLQSVKVEAMLQCRNGLLEPSEPSADCFDGDRRFMSMDSVHYLRPAMMPRSIAVVGASPRHDSLGRFVYTNVMAAGFKARSTPSIRAIARSTVFPACLRSQRCEQGRPRGRRDGGAQRAGIIDEAGRKGIRPCWCCRRVCARKVRSGARWSASCWNEPVLRVSGCSDRTASG